MLAQKSSADKIAVVAQPAAPSIVTGLWLLQDFVVFSLVCIREKSNSKLDICGVYPQHQHCIFCTVERGNILVGRHLEWPQFHLPSHELKNSEGFVLISSAVLKQRAHLNSYCLKQHLKENDRTNHNSEIKIKNEGVVVSPNARSVLFPSSPAPLRLHSIQLRCEHCSLQSHRQQNTESNKNTSVSWKRQR